MTFIEKFRDVSRGQFDFIKDSKVNIYIEARKVELVLLYPAEEVEIDDDKKFLIEGYIERIFPKGFEIAVSYKKTTCSIEQIKRRIVDFFQKKFPSLVEQVELKDIALDENADKLELKIALFSHIYSYAQKYELSNALENYFSHCFCRFISVNLQNKGDAPLTELSNRSNTIILMHDRLISANDKYMIVGQPIGSSAGYICDVGGISEGIVLAGKVNNFAIRTSKKTSKAFYTFDIDDTTGVIKCVFFPNKADSGKLDIIDDGMSVILSGKVSIDSYTKDYAVMVKSLSTCVIDYSTITKETIVVRQSNENYITIKPQKYSQQVQSDLFDFSTNFIPKFFDGREFVVFDFETTGLSPDKDMIIEIGAVKIRNGNIIETFGSFVNPLISISERISELTGITQSMVEFAPLFKDVVADFYKFCQDTTLVGHNIDGFDMKFLRRFGTECGYQFDNETIDTLRLSRRAINAKSHKLGLMCERFGIKLEGAHRAVNDCLANAKLFIELIKCCEEKNISL